MKKLLAFVISTITLSGLMTSHAYAGIKITNESLWYVIPSALVFLGMMKVTGMLAPQNVEFRHINARNSSNAAVIMRNLTYIPMIAFLCFLAWGIYGAYA